MEQILWLYALAYDPLYPVVCFDERPCFLIGNAMEPLAMQSGRVRKEHYAYEKHGSCALLAAIEPLTGNRLAQVHSWRTKKEFALFFQALAAAYPEAKKIRVVLDNLNTHDASAFYEHLPMLFGYVELYCLHNSIYLKINWFIMFVVQKKYLKLLLLDSQKINLLLWGVLPIKKRPIIPFSHLKM